ncbi:MAG: TolB family protein, partial [Planctomycetota bacterium]
MFRCRLRAALVAGMALVAVLPVVGRTQAAEKVPPVIGSSRDEYGRLGQLIDFYRTHEVPQRLVDEVLRCDALIRASDRDPLDVILRRTGALLEHIAGMERAPDLQSERSRLLGLEGRSKGTAVAESESRRRLFDQVVNLRRAVALKNPLLDFDDVLFLTHHKQGRGALHMVDQYEGHTARAGGGLYILRDAFGERPFVVDVLKEARVVNGRLRGQALANGSFISLELDYDAETIYFAWTQAKEIGPDDSWAGQFWTAAEAKAADLPGYYWSPETCYHVFKVNLDGSGLTQLTDGAWNDFDPCVLPNGRIAFVSERRGGFLRCGARPNPTYTLHG